MARTSSTTGAMTVAQRGTLTGQGPNNEYTGLDGSRLNKWVDPSAVYYIARYGRSGGGCFGYSLKVDCTTAEVTVASADGCLIAQRIEAQNLQHLDYGAAGAKTLVASFWMKSPKSGTHCVSLDIADYVDPRTPQQVYDEEVLASLDRQVLKDAARMVEDFYDALADQLPQSMKDKHGTLMAERKAKRAARP
jgi:hypothetical protein